MKTRARAFRWARAPTVGLVDQAWIDEAVRDYGESDPYVIAKVHARFPRGGSSRAIPSAWVEAAAEAPEPEGDDVVRLCDLGLAEETRTIAVVRGSWVRLGVDVAADGGDEFVIARVVGDVVTIEHSSAGAENENSVTVAGVVLRHILRAQALAAALGTAAPVVCSLDAIVVGYGISGTLRAWRSEGMHAATIVPVIVSEKPTRAVTESATMRPRNRKAEAYMAFRSLLQPGPDGAGLLRLGWLDHRTLAQFSGPKMLNDSAGYVTIERKADLKRRGVKSNDRAEACILACYSAGEAKRKGRVLA